MARRLALGGAACCLILGALTPSAGAGVANAGLGARPGGNPLAGLPWGNYSGAQDEVFPAYRGANAKDQRLLGLVALRPRVRWFGFWYPDADIESTITQYIANVTGGRTNVLAQVAVFRITPWEHAACSRLPTVAQQASYTNWIQSFAAGIGTARVALILQPDLPFARCAPHRSKLPVQMVAEAARVFSALPHTTVYLDAGAADWLSAAQAASLLRSAGVAGTRGFALNDTHYDSTSQEIGYGADVVHDLAKAGIRGQHFVINTAANGRGFTYQQYHGPDFDNAAVCRSTASQRCVTLGIPPTVRVGAARWGLTPRVRRLATSLVDAYLWIGRPWLVDQDDPFDLGRTLSLARTTPF